MLYYLSFYSLKKICARNCTSLTQKSESTCSHGRAHGRGVYVRGGGGGGYSWSNTSIKEKLRLYVGELIRGEIQHTGTRFLIFNVFFAIFLNFS